VHVFKSFLIWAISLVLAFQNNKIVSAFILTSLFSNSKICSPTLWKWTSRVRKYLFNMSITMSPLHLQLFFQNFENLDGQECMSCSELIQRKDISKIARKSAEWCECSSLVRSSKQENGVNITMIFELKRWRATTTWKRRSPLLEQLSKPLSSSTQISNHLSATKYYHVWKKSPSNKLDIVVT
jgi:hypothetical protein